MSHETRTALHTVRTMNAMSDDSRNALAELRALLASPPAAICMECGHLTRDMYPICNSCAEEV